MSSARSADLPTRQLGSQGGDLGDGRSDVRGSARRHLLLEIAPVALTVGQAELLGLDPLEHEKAEAVTEVGG